MAVNLIREVISLAESDPDRDSVIEVDGDTWSRRRIVNAACGLAEHLDAKLSQDAVVMLHGPGGGGFWSGMLAVLGTGRRVLPVNRDLPARDCEALAEAQGVSAVIETDPTGSKAHVSNVISLDVEHTIGTDVRRLNRGQEGSLLLRSSGTTGRPAVALRNSKALDVVTKTLIDTIGFNSEDRVFATLPMHHAYGMEHAVLAPMRSGACVVWKSGFDLSESVERHLREATIFPAVPFTLEAATRIDGSQSLMRLAYTAGTTLPSAVRIEFESVWGVPVGDLYGATELGTITWGTGGVANPVAGVSVQVLGDDGGTSSSGDGELLVRSDAMFDGYLAKHSGAPDRGRCVDGYLRTGDIGTLHLNGQVEITGRLKSQFDVGGLKVNPEEIEDALMGHPGVAEVAVVPLALTSTVTRVRAVIVIHSGWENEIHESLQSYSQENLAPHQRPRIFDIHESLPRTASGKLLRYQLLDDSASSP